jgi:hypothetical protein
MAHNILMYLFRFSDNWTLYIMIVLAVIWVCAACYWVAQKAIAVLRSLRPAVSAWGLPTESGTEGSEALAMRN